MARKKIIKDNSDDAKINEWIEKNQVTQLDRNATAGDGIFKSFWGKGRKKGAAKPVEVDPIED